MNNNIIIRNAKTHNLKNISLEIPKHKIVAFTGVSGSGKSSLVFDTIYTEAQRQLIETFSSFARSRMPKLSKPNVEEIMNISTSIVIDQKRMGTNMRSTVGTATELYTYLRLLFSRCGNEFIGPSFVFGFNHPSGMCPHCKGLGKKIMIDVNQLIDKDKTLKEGAINHPDYKVGGWNWRELISIGLFDVDKKVSDFSNEDLDKLLYSKGIAVEKQHGVGTYTKNFEGIAQKLERLYINKAPEELTNDRKNAYQKYFIYQDCNECNGSRINEKARKVKVNGKTIPDLINIEFIELYDFLGKIDDRLALPITTKMRKILSHLIDIGVGYLSLNRPVSTLSGGESQRVKMARQLDCDLVDLIYILDEPSIGLHPRDNDKLISMLKLLNEKGNSVFIVEHDPDMIKSADYVIDIGPNAGSKGGELVYFGNTKGLTESSGLTGIFLRKKPELKINPKSWTESIIITNANINNLQNISTKIPKGILTCITGVAGSGKSSLINDIFLKENESAIIIDQSPVAKSSRSNPATYVGIFDDIRKELSEKTGMSASLFSFNSAGACPKCKGLGIISYEMNFMDDIRVVCDECKGKRYTEEVLAVKYKDKNIDEILATTIDELDNFFEGKEINKKLDVLRNVGLGYLQLGQSLSTLSGGEAQRIKLASELHKKGNIYIMDEPTTGLHMSDINKLITIIEKLVEKNNTVVVIEHNLEVISKADWIIDMGPEGGSKGGKIIFEGLPRDILSYKQSYTGKYLKQYLEHLS